MSLLRGDLRIMGRSQCLCYCAVSMTASRLLPLGTMHVDAGLTSQLSEALAASNETVARSTEKLRCLEHSEVDRWSTPRPKKKSRRRKQQRFCERFCVQCVCGERKRGEGRRRMRVKREPSYPSRCTHFTPTRPPNTFRTPSRLTPEPPPPPPLSRRLPS